MSRYRKFTTICCAAVFALGLAACGGGSSGVPETEHQELQDQLDAAEKAKADAEKRAADAEKAKADADAEKKAAEDAAAAEKAKMEAAAMAVTAAKLFAGLEHGLGNTDNVRTGASDADGVISVTIGTAAAVPLAEDKKTTVAALRGWEGKRHTAEPTGDAGTYEAYVYSDVRPTEGNPFNEVYTLLETATATVLVGEVGVDTSDAAVAGRVASSSFDQSSGLKTFKLGENARRVVLPGSYHGVSGSFYCTPTDANTNCSSTVAANGFTLQGGSWAFKPGTPTAKVTETDDTIYASYGWWLHKSEDGNTYTASAFATARGTVPPAANIDTLRGTATYMGGAVGKYALSSATGGTNDAGHFTARATLEADFNADMVSGTIDNFMGADGMPRNWEVELKKSGVAATGEIIGTAGTGTDRMETVWTIDGKAAAASGGWSGTLYDNGSDLVPKVGTGTFNSNYGTSGRMVGAFGVNKQ